MKNLLPLASYIRKTLMAMNDLIQAYELPYKVDLEIDVNHKNWIKIAELHSINLESIGAGKK